MTCFLFKIIGWIHLGFCAIHLKVTTPYHQILCNKLVPQVNFMEFVEYNNMVSKEEKLDVRRFTRTHAIIYYLNCIYASILPAEASVTTGIASANKKYVILLKTVHQMTDSLFTKK